MKSLIAAGGALLVLAVSGCGSTDFKPAPGNSKAGPFEVIGTPFAVPDQSTGSLVIRFDVINRGVDKANISDLTAQGKYSASSNASGITWGTTCYGGSEQSTFESRADTLAKRGKKMHVECVADLALASHRVSDFDLLQIHVRYIAD